MMQWEPTVPWPQRSATLLAGLLALLIVLATIFVLVSETSLYPKAHTHLNRNSDTQIVRYSPARLRYLSEVLSQNVDVDTHRHIYWSCWAVAAIPQRCFLC